MVSAPVTRSTWTTIGGFANPNRQRSNIRHSFVECARGFRVPYGLVKELGEIVEQTRFCSSTGSARIRLRKRGTLNSSSLRTSASPSLISPMSCKVLSWILQAGNRLICQNPSIHQAERCSAFGSLKVVSGPIGIVGCSAVAPWSVRPGFRGAAQWLS